MRSRDNQVFTSLAEDKAVDKGMRLSLMVAIFLTSFSLLALEITLTRVLSVILSYHYVFMVLSLALLGLGFGAFLIHFFKPKISGRYSTFSTLALLASLFSLSIPLSILVMVQIAYLNNLQNIILFYLFFLFIPFFFAGAFLAQLFHAFPALTSRLYGMDLLGAGAGSLGAVFLLNLFGGTRAISAIGLLVLSAAVFLLRGAIKVRMGHIRLAIVSLLILSSLGSILVGSRLADIPIGKDKQIASVLYNTSAQGEIIETEWSAFGRTDLVALRNNPEAMVVFLDGTAGSPMYRFNGDIKRPGVSIEGLKTGFPGYLALANLKEEEKNNALIIGPGGGRDILLALLAGIGQVTAVEVNPDTVDIVNRYSSYNGGIYNLENVEVVVDEGRNFLRRQQEKYDVIMLSLPVTKTSRSLEGYALTENFLFTTDSISDYLEHLTDEGRLVVVGHGQVEIFRLASISLTALNQRGIDNVSAMQRVLVIGSHRFPVFIMKKAPFAPAEALTIHQSVHQPGYDPTLSYLPTIKISSYTPHQEGVPFDECATLNPLLVAISQRWANLADLSKALKSKGVDISPVTDDDPFFYKFEARIPPSVSLVLGSSLFILLVVMFVSRRYPKQRPSYPTTRPKAKTDSQQNLLRFALFFVALGVGFMLVEISIFQRFILFLGQPVLSLAVLLFSLLLGAGIGSLYSGRFASAKVHRVIAIASLSVVTLLLVYTFSLPIIFERLLGLDLTLRLLTTVVLLIPLGFFMGFPFPLGLRRLKDSDWADYVPWMWGINGISSVVGSALTVAIAISFGFTEALLVGAVCYFIAFLAAVLWRGREKDLGRTQQAFDAGR